MKEKFEGNLEILQGKHTSVKNKQPVRNHSGIGNKPMTTLKKGKRGTITILDYFVVISYFLRNL